MSSTTRQLHCRVTTHDDERLNRLAADANLSQSEFLRALINASLKNRGELPLTPMRVYRRLP